MRVCFSGHRKDVITGCAKWWTTRSSVMSIVSKARNKPSEPDLDAEFMRGDKPWLLLVF
jgi:hypothetical protein